MPHDLELPPVPLLLDLYPPDVPADDPDDEDEPDDEDDEDEGEEDDEEEGEEGTWWVACPS